MSPMSPISPAELKGWLENLSHPAELEQHPLTEKLYETEFVQRFLSQDSQPEIMSTGRAVGLAMRDFWRLAFMQRNFSPKLKRIWNTFFVLEAAYFYPFAVSAIFPGSLNELGALLCDKEYLALLVVDGDREQAQKLAAENSPFWDAIIPYDEVPSPQTVSSRRDAAIDKLTRELNRQLESTNTVVGQPAIALKNFDGQPPPLSQDIKPLTPMRDKGNSNFQFPFDLRLSQASSENSLTLQPISRQSHKTLFSLRHVRNLLGTRIFEWPQGDEINVSDLDAVAASIDIGELMLLLGMRPTHMNTERWREDRGFLKVLLSHLASSRDNDIRLQCAACLRCVQLSPIIEVEVRTSFMAWGIKPLSALEGIARLALDSMQDDFTRSLAEAILTRRTHVELLWNLDKQYAPLAQKLSIALGLQLFYDARLERLALRE